MQLNPNPKAHFDIDIWIKTIIAELHVVQTHRSAKALRWTYRNPFVIFNLPELADAYEMKFVNNDNPNNDYFIANETSNYAKTLYVPFNVENLGSGKFKAFL